MSEMLLDSALEHMESGEYAKALDRITLYIKENPTNPDAVCVLGLCHYKIGNKKKGAKELFRAQGMGSEAAEEFIRANGVELKQVNEKAVDGIGGWLLLYCIGCFGGGVLCTIGGIILKDYTIAFLGSWAFFTGYWLYTKSKNCVINAKIFQAASWECPKNCVNAPVCWFSRDSL